MSRLFGDVTQNGYVVRNVDEAIKHWVEVLGVGPFYVLPRVTFDAYRYRGVSSRPELRVALANSGQLQIELIEQLNDAESFYTDFLEHSGPGLQHLSVWSSCYDDDIARFRRHGATLIQDGVITGGARFAFYGSTGNTSLYDGTCMEVLEALPHLRDMFDEIRRASVDWDGSAPVRNISM